MMPGITLMFDLDFCAVCSASNSEATRVVKRKKHTVNHNYTQKCDTFHHLSLGAGCLLTAFVRHTFRRADRIGEAKLIALMNGGALVG